MASSQLPLSISPLSKGQTRTKPELASAWGSLDDAQKAACAWFLGPKAENAGYLKMYVENIFNDLTQCRRNFVLGDEVSTSIVTVI